MVDCGEMIYCCGLFGCVKELNVSRLTLHFCSMSVLIGNIIIHILDEESREYYKLEDMWTGSARASTADEVLVLSFLYTIIYYILNFPRFFSYFL